MSIEYRTQKDIPCDELYELFLAVGWASKETTTQEQLKNFNIGFINSTFVFSAWVNEHLIGCVRVLSDLHFRSIIYDLAVLPKYQHQGIGTELIRHCKNACKTSEWLVQTDCAKKFYEKLDFKENNDCFLTIPCKWF